MAEVRLRLRSSSTGSLVSGGCGLTQCRISFRGLKGSGTCRCLPIFEGRTTAATGQRYQTVYAQQPGSAAAPTAGLHFTSEVLERIRARGVIVRFVTLHVGLGTFQPIRVERVEDIRLHAEHYTLPEETAAAVNSARADGRRVVAAGTTTVRTLEHCALTADGAPLVAHSGSTSIFISPGFQFRVVGGLLTNFPLAAVEPVDAGERLRRAGSRSCGVSPCGCRRSTASSLTATACFWLDPARIPCKSLLACETSF